MIKECNDFSALAAEDFVFLEKAKVFPSPFALCLEFSQSQMAKLSSSEYSPHLHFQGFSLILLCFL